MSEIAERLPNVELKEWRNMVYKMVGEELKATGGRTYRRYELVNGRKEIKGKTKKLIENQLFFFFTTDWNQKKKLFY